MLAQVVSSLGFESRVIIIQPLFIQSITVNFNQTDLLPVSYKEGEGHLIIFNAVFMYIAASGQLRCYSSEMVISLTT